MLLCSFHFLLHAQQYHFRHYQVEDGLSNNTSICTLQDNKGFLWFGTKDGLNRFDGYSFKIFRNNPLDSNSIGNNSIWRLYEDPTGILWVGTERGLYSYQPSTETFRLLPGSPKNEISGITTDKNGDVWFIAGFKLFHYKRSQQKLINHHENNYLNFCTSITTGFDGKIWIGTIDGYIIGHDITTDIFFPYSVFIHSQPSTSAWIEKIYDSGLGFLLIGTSNQGIKKFDLHNCSYTDLLTYNNDGSEIYARDFIRYNEHEFWIATENGIYIYDLPKNSFTHLTKDFTNPYAISDNAVYAFSKDRNGGIWACTYFAGINYYPKQKLQFEKFFNTTNENSLKGNAVREIVEDGQGNIWIGTEDAGLNVYDKKTSAFINYYPKDGKSHLAHTNIHGLLVDSNLLWIGTFEHGLDVMNLRTRKIIRHYSYGTGPYDLKSNFIHSLYKTHSGNILIGTSNGLYIYNKKNDNFLPLHFFPSNSFFSSITEDAKGNIWVGTFKSGVFFYNPYIQKYGRLKIEFQKTNKLTENRITNLSVDQQQNLLISTEDGLYRVNTATLKTQLYTTANGLPSNLIYSAIEDDTGILWISTSKGLVRLDVNHGRSRTFTQANGILSNQFNYSSAFKDSQGLMYFGSIKGLIRFNPLDANAVKTIPALYITNLQINNTDIAITPSGPLRRSLLDTRQITLNYTQSSISLDFAAISFASSQTIEYAYILQGVDQDWNYIKTNRRVYFTNLSPGTYQFKVRSTNDNGEWSANEKTLLIKILPPWWRTNWAYLIYALLAALGIYGIVRFYHNRQSEKQQRSMELFERIKEKETYESKIDFFTKIAHEIRTPLTLIKAPLEKLMRGLASASQKEKYLAVMNKNTDRLLDLTNQLLDFRRVEAGAFALSMETKNINDLVKSIWNNFQPLAESKGIKMELTAQGVYTCKIDEEATTKIVSNLLDNAVKYCQHIVRVSIAHEGNGFVTIQISNDGPLIPADLRDKIFQPFFRSKKTDKITGTGMGLALSRSLTELQGGSLIMHVADHLNIFVLKLPTEV